jgi:hypothetical protein
MPPHFDDAGTDSTRPGGHPATFAPAAAGTTDRPA